VVVVGVDHQAVEHALHLDRHLIEHLLEIAGLDEIRDVVVGVEALAGGLDALADLHGNRRAFVNFGWAHGVGSLH
jgi:hypothetical protein